MPTPSDGDRRPWLTLEIWGQAPGASTPVPIDGLIDSGADTSALPFDYAEELGYGQRDLAWEPIRQVRGRAPAWRALRPCCARVRGIPEIEFDLCPVFIEGSLGALWGRADFMTAYSFELEEREERFTLRPLLAEHGWSETDAESRRTHP